MPARPALPTVVSAGLGAVLLGVVCAFVPAGNPLLAVGVFVLQGLLAVSWLALLGAPSRRLGVGIAMGAALAADLLLARHETDVLGALAGVIAIGLLAAVLAQLVARVHVRVTDILAAHVSTILLVSAAACLVAMRGTPHGYDAALLCMAVLTAGSVLARLVAFAGLTNHALSLLLWAGIGGCVGAAVLGWDGLLIGLATGTAAAFADLLVIAADAQRRAVLLSALLPFASGTPVAYVLSRVLLG